MDTFEELTRAGEITADLISNDAKNRFLSSDGSETFEQLGDILMKINRFGGIVTDCSQGAYSISEEGESYLYRHKQRPWISLITHKSHLKMFRALAVEDNVSVVIKDRQAVTWTYMTEDELNERNKLTSEYMLPSRKENLHCKDGRYFYSYTYAGAIPNQETKEYYKLKIIPNRASRDETWEKDHITFTLKTADIIPIDIVWTKTSEVEKFVEVLNTYFS